MPRPHRARTIALAFAAAGLVASIAPFALPAAVAGDTACGILFISGVMALLFGGGTAYFRHRDVRAMATLARGEEIIARWRVDPATWRAFVEHVGKLGPLYEALPSGDPVPDPGIEVIVGENAVQLGDAIVALPRHSTPEVTRAALHASDVSWRPSFVELGLYYPGGGSGASGVPTVGVHTVLRFPVAPEALADAQRVVAHYAGSRPGAPTFFHGRGDGTDPEDVSRCYRCGHETHAFIRRCPRCGASLQSRRWSRRFGVGLLLCGLVLTGLMGWVVLAVAPMLLQPGVRVGQTRFSGTVAQGVVILGIMALVLVLGVATALYGGWQIATGRRSLWVVAGIVGIAVVLTAITVAFVVLNP